MSTSTELGIAGEINLILEDGSHLTASGGIYVPVGGTLNIYAQSNGAKAGRLDAQASDNGAAIGGRLGENCGTVTIHGGHINATSGGSTKGGGAGIGGGGSGGSSSSYGVDAGSGGTITIYNGVVYAEGGPYAAGIGGGGANYKKEAGNSGTINIYGGLVYAQGSTGGAGIGGGHGKDSSKNGTSERINIYNGIVHAYGGGAADDIGKSSTYTGTASGISIRGGIVFRKDTGAFYSDYTLTELPGSFNEDNPNDFLYPSTELTIPSGRTLTISGGASLTVPNKITNQGSLVNKGSITVTGELSNSGTLTNNGSLTLESRSAVSGNGTIMGNGSFLLNKAKADDITVLSDLVYDGNVKTNYSTLNTTQILQGAAFTLKDAEKWKMDTKPVEVKNRGSYTVTWYHSADKSNTSVNKNFSVAPLDITGKDVEITLDDSVLTYNGEMQTKGITSVKLGGKDITYTVQSNSNRAKEAGPHTLTIVGSGNYTGTAAMTWNINKAGQTIEADDLSIVYGDTDKAVTVKDPDSCFGTLSYAVTAGEDVVSLTDGNKLVTHKLGTAKVTISAAGDKNHEPATKTITVTVSKAPQTIEIDDISVIYGDTDKMVTVKNPDSCFGTLSYLVTDGADVVSLTDGNKLVIHKPGTAKVTISTAGDEDHEPANKTITVIVDKATVTVTALDKTAYAGSQAPDLSAPILGKDYTLDGLLGEEKLDEDVFIALNYDETLDIQQVGEYPIVPTATGEDDRYALFFVNGKLTVNARPSSSAPVGKPIVPVNGSASVTVTEKEVQSGQTVSLPLEGVKPSGSGEAPEIRVIVPEKSSVTVEIPVEEVTPGTVVILVDEDGKETVVSTTKRTENGVSVTLTGNATLKIVENSKTFEDVPQDAYFNDAAAWASARNITGGTGENTFSPEQDCGRGQLVTFLWRAAGQPQAEESADFADVPAGAYYTEAIRWAAELGLVGGYGDGHFGTDDPITREQMAVILYRFAQDQGMDTTQGGMAVREFADYDSVSDYALSAIQWAVSAGLMQGYDGQLMPQGECTRAQIVTMLYRFLG